MEQSKKTPLAYVNSKIRELEKEKRTLQIKYVIFSFISFILNITTIGLSIYCIVLISQHNNSDTTATILAALSAGLIVVLFTLNVVNVVSRGLFKTRTYRQALFAMQSETTQFKYNQNDYKKAEDKEKLYLKNIKKIYKNAKSKKNKVRLSTILKAIYRGTYV